MDTYTLQKENKSSSSSSGSGCGTVGLCMLVATFALGPLDSGRVIYNNIIGDMPLLKTQVVSYVRDNIKRESGYKLQGSELEAKTAAALYTTIGNDGKVNPTNVSTETLFDAAEDHAESRWQR